MKITFWTFSRTQVFLLFNSKSLFLILNSCSCKSWVWLLCQHQWSPGSWSPCFPSSLSSSTFAATSCRRPEMWSASSPPVSISQCNNENWVLCVADVQPCMCVCVFVSSSAARSPVFSHLSSSLQGLWTIRAFQAEDRFQKAFDDCQDLHSR